jgi:hypothetical protein
MEIIMQPERLVIKQVFTPAESSQFVEFIEKYKKRLTGAGKPFFLPIPEQDELEQACTAGDAYAVFDQSGQIIATAGAFLLAQTLPKDPRDRVTIYEYGAACVDPNFCGTRPYTLQEILFWIRTLGLLLPNFKSSGQTCFLVSAAAANRAGISQTWANAEDIRHFWLDPGGVIEHAKRFVNAMHDQGIVTRQERDDGTNRRMQVHLDFAWYNRAFAAVTQIARGDATLENFGICEPPVQALVGHEVEK